jgi:hypothetical protein
VKVIKIKSRKNYKMTEKEKAKKMSILCCSVHYVEKEEPIHRRFIGAHHCKLLPIKLLMNTKFELYVFLIFAYYSIILH